MPTPWIKVTMEIQCCMYSVWWGGRNGSDLSSLLILTPLPLYDTDEKEARRVTQLTLINEKGLFT